MAIRELEGQSYSMGHLSLTRSICICRRGYLGCQGRIVVDEMCWAGLDTETLAVTEWAKRHPLSAETRPSKGRVRWEEGDGLWPSSHKVERSWLVSMACCFSGCVRRGERDSPGSEHARPLNDEVALSSGCVGSCVVA